MVGSKRAKEATLQGSRGGALRLAGGGSAVLYSWLGEGVGGRGSSFSGR